MSTGKTSPHIEALAPDILQGAGAVQPRGGSGSKSAPGGATEAFVGLSSFGEPKLVHVLSCSMPAEKAQLDQVKGDKKVYDLDIRLLADGWGAP